MSYLNVEPLSQETLESLISTYREVKEHDLRYFEEHPERTAYTRSVVEGEFCPDPNLDVDMMVVVKMSPDCRLRIALKGDKRIWFDEPIMCPSQFEV